MTDRDTTTRTRARAPGVGGVFHRMAVRDRVLRPNSERTTVATTKCTKGGCKLDGGRRMPGAGLSRRSPRKAPPGQSAFQPYWGKPAVRMIGGIEETSASFEARSAPRSYPTSLCENSNVELARRKFVSIALNRNRTALAVAVERGKGRKQYCAFSARARFHTGWTHMRHRQNS